MAANERWTYDVVDYRPPGFFAIRIGERELKEFLDKRGQQGWELVSAFPAAPGIRLKLIFKRAT